MKITLFKTQQQLYWFLERKFESKKDKKNQHEKEIKRRSSVVWSDLSGHQTPQNEKRDVEQCSKVNLM